MSLQHGAHTHTHTHAVKSTDLHLTPSTKTKPSSFPAQSYKAHMGLTQRERWIEREREREKERKVHSHLAFEGNEFQEFVSRVRVTF